MTIDAQRLYGFVEQLLAAHAPSGAESAMDALVTELAAPIGDSVWQDAADNIIIHIKGQSHDQPVAAVAHKDEIALIVKRIESDGKIRVQPLGGLHPWALGESPVEIMARDGLCPGVLSTGAKHVSTESPAGRLKDGQPLKWEQMWIETRLAAAGTDPARNPRRHSGRHRRQTQDALAFGRLRLRLQPRLPRRLGGHARSGPALAGEPTGPRRISRGQL